MAVLLNNFPAYGVLFDRYSNDDGSTYPNFQLTTFMSDIMKFDGQSHPHFGVQKTETRFFKTRLFSS